MVVWSAVALGLLAACGTPVARADFTFGEPVKVGSNIPGISGADDIDCFSYDGLEMYIASPRAGGQGDYDLWVLKRASVDEAWGPPQNLGPAVNSPQGDYYASISADGLTLYFGSWREGSSSDWTGNDDTYVTTRATRNDPWGPAVNMGPTVNRSGVQERSPWISPDGLELYFMSWRSGGYGQSDFWVTRRTTENDPWTEPVNLGPIVNSTYNESYLSLSPDGLLLLFSESFTVRPRRPGGCGGNDMWMVRRASLSAPWQTPVNLGPKINCPSDDALPRISPDGRTLYFCSDRTGWDNWQAPIDPILDFNGDRRVDDQDVMILRAHWGQNYPLCDIGPMPWGDGIVDAEDLKILTNQAVNPAPFSLEVPRDVILDWVPSETAETYDVYFGTSFEDVSTATRENPLGVLVSQGQAGTAYDPDGPLEFSRTYYWRIDEVGAPPASTISRGNVLNFTTEAYAYPIAKVRATASSWQPGWGPEKTIDGSGLDKNDGHSTTAADMWLNAIGGANPVWIQYEFDTVCKLHEMWVWNHNLQAEPFLGFGFKDVTVQYSTNGTDWTTLADVEFAQAPGQEGYAHNTTIDLRGVAAKCVKLTAKSHWGAGVPQCGLSEVRFFHVPASASRPTPASGQTGVGVDAILRWQAGRGAGSHQVCLSTDREAIANGVALVATVGDTSFDPGPLDLGRTYYWKINEIDEAEISSVWEGDIWNFSTKEYFVLDDFESYTDEVGRRIFQTWIDGSGYTEPAPGNPGNGTASQVGNLQPPFAERAIIHNGLQSMPLEYNNADAPFYSEAQRSWTEPQDWTANGADALTLSFRGNPIDFVERADGSIQISGGGVDIWGNSDQFRFVYRQLRGDGAIVAKVHSLINTSGWAKAGVMIRETLDPASAYAFMFPTPDGRRAFQNRTITGGSATSAHSDIGASSLPLWVKVERKGDQFTGYYSQDGKNWIVNNPDNSGSTPSDSANPVQFMMMGDVYIGLAVTSHNVGVPTIAELSNVSTTGTVTGQWQAAAIGVGQPSNDPAPLYVALEDDAGHVGAVTHPDPAAVLAATWQTWTMPLSNFESVNPSGVTKMYIGVGNRSNPTAGGSGLIYIDDIKFGHPLSSK